MEDAVGELSHAPHIQRNSKELQGPLDNLFTYQLSKHNVEVLFFFTVRILTVFRGLLSGIVPLHFTRRNEANYPVNHRQNEQEILESKELCECICHQIETLTICWFKILFAYLYIYIYIYIYIYVLVKQYIYIYMYIYI